MCVFVFAIFKENIASDNNLKHISHPEHESLRQRVETPLKEFLEICVYLPRVGYSNPRTFRSFRQNSILAAVIETVAQRCTFVKRMNNSVLITRWPGTR